MQTRRLGGISLLLSSLRLRMTREGRGNRNLRHLGVLGLAAILGLSCLGQSAQAGSYLLTFDPSGTSIAGSPSGGAIAINQWNLSNSNAIDINSVASTHALTVGQSGMPFTTAFQGIGSTFQQVGGMQASASGFSATGSYSVTPTLTNGSAQAQALSFVVNGGTATLNNIDGTATISGAGSGLFTWTKTTTPNLATGTGFTTGTTVATGTFFNIVGGSLGNTGTGIGSLGGIGTTFASTTPSEVSFGGESVGILFSNLNPGFFPDVSAGDSILAVMNTTLETPFGGSTVTSSAFFNGHTTTFPASGINGGNGTTDTSGDFLFQATNPAIDFYLVTPQGGGSVVGAGGDPPTPEPSTLALMGLGSVALLAWRRRKG